MISTGVIPVEFHQLGYQLEINGFQLFQNPVGLTGNRISNRKILTGISFWESMFLMNTTTKALLPGSRRYIDLYTYMFSRAFNSLPRNGRRALIILYICGRAFRGVMLTYTYTYFPSPKKRKENERKGNRGHHNVPAGVKWQKFPRNGVDIMWKSPDTDPSVFPR